MKKVIILFFYLLYMVWNIPFLFLFGFLSLWHWDIEYLNDYGEGMVDTYQKAMKI